MRGNFVTRGNDATDEALVAFGENAQHKERRLRTVLVEGLQHSIGAPVDAWLKPIPVLLQHRATKRVAVKILLQRDRENVRPRSVDRHRWQMHRMSRLHAPHDAIGIGKP